MRPKCSVKFASEEKQNDSDSSSIKSKTKTTRRSQSLDRIYEDSILEIKEERQSRRQFMRLVN